MTPTTEARPGFPLDARQRAMLEAMGVPLWWPAAAEGRPPATAPIAAPAPHAVPPAQPVLVHRAMPQNTSDGADTLDWDGLQQAMAACSACGLSQGRQHVVAGAGDVRPDWLIVGEAPGGPEDQTGEPFADAAGEMLDQMLFAMGLARGQKVYLTYGVKCRPPHSRSPEPAEVAQCSHHLRRQIALLKPRIVLALGRLAAQAVLAGAGLDAATLQRPLGRLRGEVFALPTADGEVPVVVSYPPATLLRSPADKGKVWADLCLAMARLKADRPPA